MKSSLLAATIELLKDNGTASATARAICAEVGVKQPALYYHYGQLEYLHQAAVSKVFKQVAGYYQPATDEKSAMASIHKSWALFTRFAYENPKIYMFINAQIVKGNLPESVSHAFENLVEDLEVLAKTRTLNIDSFSATQMLWAGANGAATLTAAATSNAQVNTEVAAMMLDALLDYLFAD